MQLKLMKLSKLQTNLLLPENLCRHPNIGYNTQNIDLPFLSVYMVKKYETARITK